MYVCVVWGVECGGAYLCSKRSTQTCLQAFCFLSGSLEAESMGAALLWAYRLLVQACREGSAQAYLITAQMPLFIFRTVQLISAAVSEPLGKSDLLLLLSQKPDGGANLISRLMLHSHSELTELTRPCINKAACLLLYEELKNSGYTLTEILKHKISQYSFKKVYLECQFRSMLTNPLIIFHFCHKSWLTMYSKALDEIKYIKAYQE